MKKTTVIIIVLIVLSIFVVNVSSLEKAVFINVKPTIRMGDIEYLITNDIISSDKLIKQVGKVTQIIELASYMDNPYKNPSRVYKIKDKKIEEEVALKMNSKFYIAKFIGYISDK